MADVHTKEVRKYNMSRIKGKDTKPEIIVRKFLFSKGFRYRLNVIDLPGKPDIVLKKYNTVIFINGCFWHGHTNCKYFILPKTNAEWWKNKIEKNQQRDVNTKLALKEMGWNIITIWECQLKKNKKEQTLSQLENILYRFFLDKYKVK